MQITRHARIEIVIAIALFSSSCSRPAWEDKLDVADVNARNAIDRVAALESRVEEIERVLR